MNGKDYRFKILRLNAQHIPGMLFRYDQRVVGRAGVYIQHCDCFLVFVKNEAGQAFINDLTENAGICHGFLSKFSLVLS